MTIRFPIFRRSTESDFERLLRPHVRELYSTAYRFTGDVDEAEDLVQSLMVKLFPRASELRDVDDLGPWLKRVLYRQFVDGYRRQSCRPLGLVDHTDRGVDGEDAMDVFPSAQPGPDDHAERELLQTRLRAALDGLEPHHRSVVALHDVEGYSLQELERILETPVGTLKSRLHRARRHLRELLEMEPQPGAVRVSE